MHLKDCNFLGEYFHQHQSYFHLLIYLNDVDEFEKKYVLDELFSCLFLLIDIE